MKLEETSMRKRISVCMLAVMMSVTSMYLFVVQGAENETGSETETSIEVKSDAEIDTSVDPMSANKLLVKIRVIQPEEILDAYFGKENWDENLLSEEQTIEGSSRNLYDNEKQKILITSDGIVYETILVTYKEGRPDEESMIEEWEKLLQTLNIDIMDEYIRQTDYFGVFVSVSVEKDGYIIKMQRLPEIVQIEEVSQRQRITDEEALQAVYDAVWDALQIPALETNPIADSLQVEVQYIPVDMGTNAGEYVYDIGFYVKQLIDQDGADKLWHFTGLVDATMPYCYSFTMAEDSDEEFQTEHLKISDRKK